MNSSPFVRAGGKAWGLVMVGWPACIDSMACCSTFIEFAVCCHLPWEMICTARWTVWVMMPL